MTPAVWSRTGLHDLIEREFAGMRVIAVSNREPYIHRCTGDGIECIRPPAA